MRVKTAFLFLSILLCAVKAISQPCTTLGQTPSTAFPVCGTNTFTQSNVPNCGGTPIPNHCTGGIYADLNPFWYRFTCYTSGTLGFILDPVNNNDDYDWVLFDITGRNPGDIYTDLSLNISENWSGNPGNTGATNNTNGHINCAGNTPNFNSLIGISGGGREYLLMVSNFSASQQGYSLTFTGGTAIITNPLLPLMQSSSVNCAGTQVTVRFNKKIRCNSLAANGSDFTIAGATILSAAGYGCASSFDLDSVLLTLSAPLAPGNYTLTMTNGSDGNTLLDNCGTGILSGSTIPFTVNAQSPLPMGVITAPPCIPASISLSFTDRINCSSIAADGSDFIITGPSPVTVASAVAATCINGETNTVTIQFTTPILVSGNYQVLMMTGSDGNTLTGQCNRQVTAGSNALFTLAAQPPLPMGIVAPPSCSPSSITINFTDPLDCTSISPDGSEFAITGPSGVTITSAAGQCNINPNIRSIIIQLASPITVSGTYQLQVMTGSDGNTIRGDCNRYIAVGDLTTFIIPDAPPVLMDSLVPVACSPSSLRLLFDAPVRCSSVAANGSDFIISGPSAITITSATGTCDANGLATQIDIQLSSPVVVGGNYQLQLVTGSDGNTLLSECYRPTPLNSLTFTANDTVSAAFQHQVQYDCETDIITFSHDGQHNVNQWAWTVNGNPASTLQTFSQSFSAFSQNQVQLVVTNGLCTDTHTENIVLDNKVAAAFQAPDMICPEDSALFIDNSTGAIDNWQWTFGNGNTSSLQIPPGQFYPFTGTETLYTVSLTVSNNNGCRTTATRTVKVFGSCMIAVPNAFTPNNDGLNDYLYPLNAFKAENLDFKVFDRWGQLVFQSKDWTKRWDGKINGMMQGTNVFVWTLHYTHRDTKIKYSLKGTTTLIR